MDVVADDIGLVTSTDVVTYVTGSEAVSPSSENHQVTSGTRDGQGTIHPQLQLGIFSDEHDLITLQCRREQGSIDPEKESVGSARNSVKKKASGQSVLARKVSNKKFANGDIFTGLVDVMTGFPLQGQLKSAKSGDAYEGPFSQGQRHGNGAVLTKRDGTKFLGRYVDKQLHDIFFRRWTIYLMCDGTEVIVHEFGGCNDLLTVLYPPVSSTGF